jgi:hypothetical protein
MLLAPAQAPSTHTAAASEQHTRSSKSLAAALRQVPVAAHRCSRPYIANITLQRLGQTEEDTSAAVAAAVAEHIQQLGWGLQDMQQQQQLVLQAVGAASLGDSWWRRCSG